MLLSFQEPGLEAPPGQADLLMSCQSANPTWAIQISCKSWTSERPMEKYGFSKLIMALKSCNGRPNWFKVANTQVL